MSVACSVAAFRQVQHSIRRAGAGAGPGVRLKIILGLSTSPRYHASAPPLGHCCASQHVTLDGREEGSRTRPGARARRRACLPQAKVQGQHAAGRRCPPPRGGGRTRRVHAGRDEAGAPPHRLLRLPSHVHHLLDPADGQVVRVIRRRLRPTETRRARRHTVLVAHVRRVLRAARVPAHLGVCPRRPARQDVGAVQHGRMVNLHHMHGGMQKLCVTPDLPYAPRRIRSDHHAVLHPHHADVVAAARAVVPHRRVSGCQQLRGHLRPADELRHRARDGGLGRDPGVPRHLSVHRRRVARLRPRRLVAAAELADDGALPAPQRRARPPHRRPPPQREQHGHQDLQVQVGAGVGDVPRPQDVHVGGHVVLCRLSIGRHQCLWSPHHQGLRVQHAQDHPHADPDGVHRHRGPPDVHLHHEPHQNALARPRGRHALPNRRRHRAHPSRALQARRPHGRLLCRLRLLRHPAPSRVVVQPQCVRHDQARRDDSDHVRRPDHRQHRRAPGLLDARGPVLPHGAVRRHCVLVHPPHPRCHDGLLPPPPQPQAGGAPRRHGPSRGAEGHVDYDT